MAIKAVSEGTAYARASVFGVFQLKGSSVAPADHTDTDAAAAFEDGGFSCAIYEPGPTCMIFRSCSTQYMLIGVWLQPLVGEPDESCTEMTQFRDASSPLPWNTKFGGHASAGQKSSGEGGGHFSGIVAMAVADKDVDEADAPTESQTTGLVSGIRKARRPEGYHRR